MSGRKKLIYWVVVGTTMALIAFVAYLRGDQTDPWPLFRVAVVVAICAVLLLIHSFSAAAWRKAAQYARSRESGRYKRDPAARVGGGEAGGR